MNLRAKMPEGSHILVFGAVTAVGCQPRDIFVRVFDVAGLAVHAVRRVKSQCLAAGFRVGGNLKNLRRAILLAGRALDFNTLLTDSSAGDNDMRRLFFIVLGTRIKNIHFLVKGQNFIKN